FAKLQRAVRIFTQCEVQRAILDGYADVPQSVVFVVCKSRAQQVLLWLHQSPRAQNGPGMPRISNPQCAYSGPIATPAFAPLYTCTYAVMARTMARTAAANVSATSAR